MRRVTLTESLELSRLSFGTASMHHVRSRRDRQNLLAAAVDYGFTHFDTAPLYGYGLAESELGAFLRCGRSRVTVATKVGLYPPRRAGSGTVSVWARKAIGKVAPGYNRPVEDWSVRAATRSLEASLQRLRTDYIDLLLLHEPDPTKVDAEEFSTWIEAERARGRVLASGLAGPVEKLRPLLTHNRLASVLQVHDSLDRREADQLHLAGREAQLTYGYLSSRHNGETSANVSSILQAALARDQNRSILVSSRNVIHVAELARIAAGE